MLAAGAGTRLRPLTEHRPKALCPVNNIPLLDSAIDRLLAVTGDIAVNAHHLANQIVEHVGDRAHLSVEHPIALGTAGAVGLLQPWLDGRAVIVTNADAWGPTALDRLVADWDGEHPRLLVAPAESEPDFADERGQYRFAGTSLLPAAAAAGLRPEPGGLYEVVWRHAEARGDLELVLTDEAFLDCGTSADYLAANLCASGGASVIGAGAVVEGEVVRSVVWPGGYVGPDERLVECIRVGRDLTVRTT